MAAGWERVVRSDWVLVFPVLDSVPPFLFLIYYWRNNHSFWMPPWLREKGTSLWISGPCIQHPLRLITLPSPLGPAWRRGTNAGSPDTDAAGRHLSRGTFAAGPPQNRRHDRMASHSVAGAAGVCLTQGCLSTTFLSQTAGRWQGLKPQWSIKPQNRVRQPI